MKTKKKVQGWKLNPGWLALGCIISMVIGYGVSGGFEIDTLYKQARELTGPADVFSDIRESVLEGKSLLDETAKATQPTEVVSTGSARIPRSARSGKHIVLLHGYGVHFIEQDSSGDWVRAGSRKVKVIRVPVVKTPGSVKYGETVIYRPI